jgi:osomolarity two-component system response regulator SKN7
MEHPSAQPEDAMASTSDFVKKLYKMLEDPSISGVVSWGPSGDCFVVKDMTEFTKSILPRMFKHSNFASFVRQLNKYDFHKVKNNDDNQFGEQSWTFRHPDFHADRPECLENIKRKVPSQRKPVTKGNATPPPSTPGADGAPMDIAALQAELAHLRSQQAETDVRVREMAARYEGTIAALVEWQRGMAQTDGIMRQLITYFLSLENGERSAPATSNPLTSGSLAVPPPEPDLSSFGLFPTPPYSV